MTVLKRRGVLAVVLAAAVGGGATAVATYRRRDAAAPERLAPRTVEATVMDLVDAEEAEGELGFGEALPLRRLKTEPPPSDPAKPDGAGEPADQGQQLVTWLAPVGSTVARGEPLFRVDDRPVALLFGALPIYRRLTVGVEGPDVKQLEQNLRAMDVGDLTTDESFTDRTAAVVKRWQRSLGLK